MIQRMLGGARIADVYADREITYLALDNGVVISIAGAWQANRA